MAERRMFSIKIIDSDEFLDLPLEAQSLYFHLAMRADDDGFLNSSRRLVRTIGASQDDLKMLVDKRFIILFDSGVVAIRHWKVHNCIRKDRYKSTMFLSEKKQLISDETDTYVSCIQSTHAANPPQNSGDNQVTTIWQPTDNQTSTQYSIGKDSIDKVSLGKSSIGEERIEKINLGEGSINTSPAPRLQNKYEEDFSSDWAVAPFPTKEDLEWEDSYLPEPQRDGGEVLRNDVMHSINDELRYDVAPRSNDVALRANVAFGKKGNHPSVDEVLSSKSNETPYDIHSESAVDTPLKPVDGPYGRGKAFPSGGRGTALAVDEVSSSKSDEALYDIHSESAGDTSLKPVDGPYGRGVVCLTEGQLADLKTRLGEPQLNRYLDKLASFISSRGARIKSHYDTIIKWHNEDSENAAAARSQHYAPSYYSPARYQPAKPRYGSFDPTEAFEYALKRSMREMEEALSEESSED